MKRIYFITLIICALQSSSHGQTQIGFTMPSDVNKVAIPFEEINNLVVVPVVLNNLLKLKFVVDTGVETPILTEPAFANMLNIDFIRQILISGPGLADSIRAKVGQKVNFSLPGGVVGHNLNLLVLEDDYLKLSEKMGDEVYGIIGYDLFKQFVVDMDYDDKIMTLYRPEKYRPRKNKTAIPLDLINSKPYIQTIVSENETADTLRLLIDSGASHALLLDLEQSEISMNANTVDTRLGTGLGGDIPGVLGRIDQFGIPPFQFSKIIISVPKPDAYSQVIKRGSRHGTIGGDVLSRLHPTFDFSNRRIYFSKANRYKTDFEFDMSGMSLVRKGLFLDSVVVDYVRKDTPAYEMDIRPGDFVLSINSLNTFAYSLSDFQAILRKRPNYRIKMRLFRDGEKLKKKFKLRRSI